MILTQWLEHAPANWLRAPAWSVFDERGEKAAPSDIHLTPSQLYGVLPQSEYMEITGNRVVLNLTGVDNMKAVRKGDFISHLRSFQGGLEASYLDGKVSTAYTVLKPAQEIHNGYFRHLMKSRIFIEQLNNLTDQLRDGQTINYARFAQMTLPLPPLDTQRAIADYLDRETAEIDAMIAKMDELANTLEARKSDAIQRETTASNLPMSRVKFFADVSLGKTFQGAQRSDHERFVNYVRAASIQTYGLALDDQRMWMSEDELRKYDLRRNDVLIVEGGAGYGRSVVLEADMPGWGFQNHVIRLRPAGRVDGRFLDYCIKSHFRGGLIDILVDGATIPALSSDKARELPVPDLAPTEQKRIADHLDEVTGRVDQMLAKTAELKSLLIERRSALITDVVTGKKQLV